MPVTLEEVKQYLRVDYDDENALLFSLITAATELCAHVARMTTEELTASDSENIRIAVLYTIAYLYEHREEADHHELTLTLRALLFGVREEDF